MSEETSVNLNDGEWDGASLYGRGAFLRGFHGNSRFTGRFGRMGIPAIMAVALVGLTWAISYWRGVCLLPEPGVGFLQHYGIIAILAMFPLMAGLIGVCASRLSDFVKRFPALVANTADRPVLDVSGTIVRILGDRKRWIRWRVGLHTVGLVLASADAYFTGGQQESYYYHDVFDSIRHPVPYIWTRTVFFFMWGYLLPASAFLGLRVVAVGRSVCGLIGRDRHLRLSALLGHGLSGKGAYLAFAVSCAWPLALGALVVFALYASHGITVMLVAGTAILTALVIVVVASVIRPFRRAICTSAEHYLSVVSARIDSRWAQLGESGGVPARHGDPCEGDEVASSTVEELLHLSEVLHKLLRLRPSFWARTNMFVSIMAPGVSALLGEIVNRTMS